MTAPIAMSLGEPTESAWARAGAVAARILEGLALRDASEEAERLARAA